MLLDTKTKQQWGRMGVRKNSRLFKSTCSRPVDRFGNRGISSLVPFPQNPEEYVGFRISSSPILTAALPVESLQMRI